MINPKSLENLRSFDKMDKELHKALSSKGGKAAAISKRERKEDEEFLAALHKYGDRFVEYAKLCEKSPRELKRILEEY